MRSGGLPAVQTQPLAVVLLVLGLAQGSSFKLLQFRSRASRGEGARCSLRRGRRGLIVTPRLSIQPYRLRSVAQYRLVPKSSPQCARATCATGQADERDSVFPLSPKACDP